MSDDTTGQDIPSVVYSDSMASGLNRWEAAEAAAKSYFKGSVRFEDRTIEDPEDGSVVEVVRLCVSGHTDAYMAYIQFLRGWWVIHVPTRRLTLEYDRPSQQPPSQIQAAS